MGHREIDISAIFHQAIMKHQKLDISGIFHRSMRMCKNQKDLYQHVEQLSCLPPDLNQHPNTCQLMDLPDDCLAGIIMAGLKIHNWYAVDLAMCNKRLLSILREFAQPVLKLLQHKPWFISDKVLYANDWEIFFDKPDGLRLAAHYLEKGWIKRMELTILSGIEFPFSGSGPNHSRAVVRMSDDHLNQLLEGRPINKIVLVYPHAFFVTCVPLFEP